AKISKPSLNRRDLLKGTLAAGTLSLTGPFMPAIAQARTLKLGYVSPKSGPLALFGQGDEFVVRTVMAELGAGLRVGGKTYPVTIISKDTQSNSNRAAEVTNELILNDRLDLVLVSSAPQTVNPVPDDEDGRAWSDKKNGAPALLSARNYSVVPSGFFRDLGDDFSAVISTFKDAGCQIVTGAPLPPDFTTFWTQARQQGFRPKAAS